MTIAAELLPGTLVDRRYRIQRVLGRGGFGRTYLVVDKGRFGELCVLKEFAPSNRGDAVVTQKLRELFQREATILHKLDHPQIPKFFAVFEENGRLFIVQEYINGKTYWTLLREKHQNGMAFTEAEIVQWLRDLLKLLKYLHKHNIIHRDISPDNVMLAQGKKLPILIDFGAVKQAASQYQQSSHSISHEVIQASVSLGKSGYAPNEQLRMGQCSTRSDLYALAVTAVVLLTAKPPNQLIDPSSLAWNWQHLVRLDPLLVKILEKMMAEKPRDRYDSAELVLKDLRRVKLAGAGIPTAAIAAPTAVSPEESTQLQFKLGSLFPPFQAQTTRLQKVAEELQAKGFVLPQFLGAIDLEKLNLNKLNLERLNLDKLNLDKLNLTWNKLVLGGCLALLPLGILIGVQSSNIAGVCNVLDNCTRDSQAKIVYEEALRQAKTAEALSQMAKNLPDLKLARKQLAEAIAQLSSLTTDQELSGIVRQILPGYRNRLDSLEARLAQESSAFDLLGRAKAEARKADELTTLAMQTQDYEIARQQWVKALGTLQAIRQSTFAQGQVMARSQEYTTRLEAVNLRLGVSPQDPQVNPQVNPQVAQNIPVAQSSMSQAPVTQQPMNQAAVSQQPNNPFAALVGAVAVAPAAPPAAAPVTSPTVAPRAVISSPAVPRAVISSPAAPRRVAATSIPAAQPRSRVILPRASSVAQQPAPPRPSLPQPAAAPAPRTEPARVASTIRSAPQMIASASRTPSLEPAPVAPQPPITPQQPITMAPPSQTTPGSVELVAAQTLNNVSIQLDSATVAPNGTVAANIVVENHSDRSFGFVPLFAEVKDADGNTVRSRVHFIGAEDGIAEPGEVLHGKIHMFDRQWNRGGAQNLALVIQEGTTGSRNFRLTF